MRILFTKAEGGLWTPLYLHNIDRKGLENLLTEGIGDITIKRLASVRGRSGHHTILKGMNVSSTILPDLPYEEDVKFHSLMMEDGLIFDSTLYATRLSDGLDHRFFQIKDFGLPADRFEELWKDMSKRVNELWKDKKIKERKKKERKYGSRRRGKRKSE